MINFPLVYEVARERSCKQAGGCRYFGQKAVFRLSHFTESMGAVSLSMFCCLSS
jgi:hypothetical protein